MQTQHTRRRRSTVAKEWQLAVLKNLHSESENPAEEQLLAAATETGLDEKWVRNWFTRQRSKVAARSTKGKLATTEPRQQRAQVPTFKLDLRASPNGSQQASHRAVSSPVYPTPCPSAKSPRQPSPINAESQSPRLVRPAEAIPRAYRSISAPTYFNNSSVNTVPFSRTTAIPTYSRDPLCNRYPDFSQFFLPQVQERPPIFELPTPTGDHNQLVPLLAVPNMDPYTPMHMFNASNPLHPPPQLSSPVYLGPCPVAFSMRLVDLWSHP